MAFALVERIGFAGALIRRGILPMLCAAACAGTAAAASFTTVYSFTGAADGGVPNAPLTAAAGIVYGVTSLGGDLSCTDTIQGCGAIFALHPSGSLKVLHDFTGGANGGEPTTGLSLIQGSLYGGALALAAGLGGVVYSIKPDGTGYTVLHEFSVTDGDDIQGLLQPSGDGGVFGIAQHGGTSDQGTLFYLAEDGSFQVVHNFGKGTGRLPNDLVEDAAGNLYGSTLDGGAGNYGVIFKFARRTQRFSVIYQFTNGADGETPQLGAVGSDGTLYGAAENGGGRNGGLLFSLTPSGGQWTFTTLTPIVTKYRLDFPADPPSLSSSGALVGATAYGGVYEFKNGKLSVAYTPVSTNASLLLSPDYPNVILGTSMSGGASICAIPDFQSCGFIFELTH